MRAPLHFAWNQCAETGYLLTVGTEKTEIGGRLSHYRAVLFHVAVLYFHFGNVYRNKKGVFSPRRKA